jgi:hypothetical protein
MSDMEEVKTAIGEDDPFPFCLEIFNDPPQIVSLFDLFPHSQSPTQNLPDLTLGVNPCKATSISLKTLAKRDFQE